MIREDLSATRGNTADADAVLSPTETTWLDRSVGSLARVNWETVAWVALLLITVVSRFYDVGVRAMSHDESLHTVYSYQLYREGTYVHNPMMHGPWLFHANALIYALFGVSDATSRMAPALTGIAMVAIVWAFRRWLGRTGALMAGVLFVVSPSILFHSRYIREDIFFAFSGMVWIYSMFRYIEDRQIRWLYIMILGMLLGFLSKEAQFMNGAVYGVFMVGVALWRWWRENEALNRSVFADLAVLMLTLVLPFTSPFGYLVGERLLGWETVNWSSFTASAPMLIEFTVLVLLCIALSIGLAWYWFGVVRAGDERQRLTFPVWGGLMLAFWAIAIIFYTTFFTNPVNGLATGIVGSLGYWIAQHEVQRGSQPWYYYGLLTSIYEFLPFLLTVGGAAALFNGLRNRRWDPVPQHDLPADQREEDAPILFPMNVLRRLLILFFLVWTVGAWSVYSYAGEKMPWLLTHMVQPMALLGGWWIGQLISRVDWRTTIQKQGYWPAATVGLIGLVPALIFSLWTVFAADPFGGRDLASIGGTVRFVFGLILTGGLLYLGWSWVTVSGWRNAARMMVLGVSAVLLLLTVRASYRLTYVNYDMATEYLVYAHAGPDVKRALAEIDLISERTVGDREIRVAYSNDAAWPMSWYMKFYPNSVFFGTTPNQDSMSSPVVIAARGDYDKVDPYLARDYVYRNYRMIWWPEESYKDLTLSQVWDALTDPVRRERLWQIWYYRNHPDRSIIEWPHRHEFRLYVRRDLAQTIWDLNVTPIVDQRAPAFNYPEIDLSAVAVYGGVYDDQVIRRPRDVAVGPDGSRYILDTGNNRVVILDAAGNFMRAFGSSCLLNDQGQPGCVDPDGAGPLALGDGQFREPWGITVAEDGAIFVADTWNGRIQVFDAEGNFLRKWGTFAIVDETNRDPFGLFGPRGLAIAANGDLLVADTGNKRIIQFTPEGGFVNQVGGGGVVLGRFEEPVDMAVDPNTGNVVVADIWNQRLQILSPELVPLAEWPVPSWQSQDINDKAYVAVDANSTVYASDPQFAQIFVYNPAGQIQAGFGQYGMDLNRFGKPNGLAIDPLTNQLLVADADNNRVMVFPVE
ncbi:MAG: TIGR03663 family protein [Caldilineaceae bacterium]|nr:TIGR03663 family protein [Caldilineaceae bacterium]